MRTSYFSPTDSITSDLNQLTIGTGSKTSTGSDGTGRGGSRSGHSGTSSGWDSTSVSITAFADSSVADSLSGSILSGVATERKRNLGGS